MIGLVIYAVGTYAVVEVAGGTHVSCGRQQHPQRHRPGPARLQVSLADWRGRTVVITGGNSGIGLEAALALRRPEPTSSSPAATWPARRAVAQGMTVRELDLADLDSVEAFAAGTDHVDALVCNAGVMGGPLLGTVQGHERQMGTNHLGHAALVARLFPLLEKASGRVVIISSIAARGGKLGPDMTVDDLVSPPGYLSQAVYANTKQANLLFAQELHRRVGDRVASVAAHPGVSWTNLFPASSRTTARAGWCRRCGSSGPRRCSPPRPGPSRPCGRCRSRAVRSSGPSGSTRSADRPSCSRSTAPRATRSPPHACGRSPSRSSASRFLSESGTGCVRKSPRGNVVAASMKVEIWSDVACPWCYIGKRRFEAAVTRFPHPVEVEWKSFELDPHAVGGKDGDYATRLAQKYGRSVPQAQQMLDDMTATAAVEGLDFHFELAQAGSTFDAHRVLHLAGERGVQDAMKERLVKASFTEGEPVHDHETLVHSRGRPRRARAWPADAPVQQVVLFRRIDITARTATLSALTWPRPARSGSAACTLVVLDRRSPGAASCRPTVAGCASP